MIANQRNVGFGAAVNQAFHASTAPYLVTLNDDAVADPRWLETLLADADAHPVTGMFASEVRLAGTGTLDSAGMLIACRRIEQAKRSWPASGTFFEAPEALFPSGSAALYRRSMLEEIGLFDESFFLYCEDTDLGLRAQWAGWGCRYVPGAVVEHRYSHSAGRASPLKAYYVERNRLYTIVKNFPASMLLGGAVRIDRALLLARDCADVRSRQDGGISRRRPFGGDAAMAGGPGQSRYVVSFAGPAAGSATHPGYAADHIQ